MRTSRVSRETSRFFNGISESAVIPRRSTRSTRTSLARFTYDDDSTASKDDSTDVTYGSDIEDAIKSTTPSPPPNGGTRTASRKRKRTATTTMTSGRSAPAVKTEKIETPISSPNKPPPARRVRKPARATTDPTTGAATTSPPSDWEEMYAVAKEMRLGNGAAANAAVDTMGCERLALPGASARDRRFHTLIALMLSSQTKDTVNAQAMKRLTTEMPPYEPGKEPGLNLENVLAVEPALLNDFIGKVGFHNNKTKYIKQAAEILRDHHNSDIPTTIEGLMSLPGVGPKMAHLCMAAENGWGRVEGIGVDVHVHRITNLWGWQSPPTKGPEDTRRALESWLPHDRWKEINWLLVGLGQTVCLPVGRKCGDCELGLRGLCKAAERKKVIEGRKRREVLVNTEGNGEVVKYETVEVKAIKEEVGVKEEAEVKEEVVEDEVSSESRASVKEEEF